MLLLLRLKAEARSDPFQYLKGLFGQIGNTFFHGLNNAFRANRDILMNATRRAGPARHRPASPTLGWNRGAGPGWDSPAGHVATR